MSHKIELCAEFQLDMYVELCAKLQFFRLGKF